MADNRRCISCFSESRGMQLRKRMQVGPAQLVKNLLLTQPDAMTSVLSPELIACGPLTFVADEGGRSYRTLNLKIIQQKITNN